jgi:mycothiol system anti-sigma-R factor
MKHECREALERVYLFLDGEVLSHAERVDIKMHLEACRPCYERYGLDDEISRLVARLRGRQHCPDALRARIQSLLQEG